MDNFELGETVICSITLMNISGDLQNPVGSMKLIIEKTRPDYTLSLSSTDMVNDSTGVYHYDFETSSATIGEYQVTYTAVDGSRTTKQTDTFTII